MKELRTPYCFLLWGIMMTIMGCAGRPHYSLVPDYTAKPPRSIAILPAQNETVTLKAPEEFRPLVHSKISAKGYETLGIAEIDKKLQGKGIRDAGQIHSLTPQELGKLLGVDAVLYTTVTEFSTAYLLAYASMRVGARFELKDAKTGEKLWESDHRVTESKVGLDKKAMEESAKFAAFQAYAPYMKKVVAACLATLPDGPLAPPPKPKAGCLLPPSWRK